MFTRINNCHLKRFVITLLFEITLVLPLQDLMANYRPQDDVKADSSSQISSQKSFFIPGDAVGVSTFPDTSSFLNQIFPIDDRGYVDLPIYGETKIDNMSESEFENYLKTRYKDYLRFPHIQIKPLIRVSVLGGVPTPGFVYFDPNLSLWELIHQAGGTLDEDGLKEMRWERSRESVSENLIPYLQDGTSLKNIGLRSGDQIWVKTPGKPGFWEKAQSYFPIFTFITGMVTFYYTYRILLEDRRSGRIR